MMQTFSKVVLAAVLAATPVTLAVAARDPVPTVEQQARIDKAKAILQAQKRQTGTISIPEAKASLNLGKDYYFIDAAESRKVLVDIWDNPPESANGVLGMVFPAGKLATDNTWGAVITYEKTGHVADDDAKSADYDALLKDMQSGEGETNKQRAEGGYPPLHLVGWAQRPTYDPKSHSVVWAQNIKFGMESDNSLNYDVRLLGRHGVLSLNLLSTMSHLGEIDAAAKKFAQTAAFDAGARYTDFVEGTDEKAAYGVGGLVAAGLGVAAAKKLGILAVILGLGKKLLIPILLVFGFVGNKLRGLFVRKSEDQF